MVLPSTRNVGIADGDLAAIGTERLVRSPSAPRRGREAIAEWVGEFCPALDSLLLVTSELVTNGVKHSDVGTRNRWIILRLLEGADVFCIEVTDPGSQTSLPHQIPFHSLDLNQDTESGRGLALVNEFSRGRWETYLIPGSPHRVVRCLIDIDPSPTGAVREDNTAVSDAHPFRLARGALDRPEGRPMSVSPSTLPLQRIAPVGDAGAVLYPALDRSRPNTARVHNRLLGEPS
jgi:anti-sigma regulatory factor (Ser/Thr protein kinase)